MVGTTISHYKVLEKIGQGGMGEVYLAEDTRLGRNVAVKFLPEKFAQNRMALERFRREARAASALNHPNICVIYDIGEHEGQPFIVMEYLEGQTLSSMIQDSALSTDQLLKFGAQVAEALKVAHSKGIIHRDIKPANVIVTESGSIKLLDFGLAKLAEAPYGPQGMDSHLTAVGMAVGTPYYMSPEQLMEKEVDARSDIFSFGVLLYEMATGTLPFTGKDIKIVFNKILTTSPTSLLNSNPECPAELERLIQKALEKDPEERYQSAKEILVDLKRLRRDSSGEVVARAAKQRGYFWPTFVGGAMVLVLLALSLFWPFTPTLPREVIDSIAVLAFENRSGDPDLDYVSDGIAEGIISRLAQLSSLNKVISSSSVRQFKNKEVDARTVAQEVDVRAVVMGNMTSQGETIRIFVELIDAESNSTLWGDTYTRPRSELYEIEEYLSKEIADVLGIQLSGEEEERLTRRYTENSEAHEAYLKARSELAQFTPESLENAIQHFEEAIGRDPNYAPAYAAMAYCYYTYGIYLADMSSQVPKVEEMAKKALELDDTLGEAHAVLGNVRRSFYWDWDGAEKEYRLAMELDPSSYEAPQGYAYLMSVLGRHDEAITLSKHAQLLDPLNFRTRMSLATQLYRARRYNEAVEQSQTVLDMNPNYGDVYRRLLSTYEATGLWDKAAAAWQKLQILLYDAGEEQVAGLTNAAASGGDRYWRWMLDYRTEQAKQGEYLRPTSFVAIYAQLGEKDEAFEWLEKAYEERDVQLPFLTVEPLYDPLRDDPRFHDLLGRMNLEP